MSPEADKASYGLITTLGENVYLNKGQDFRPGRMVKLYSISISSKQWNINFGV